MKKTETMVKSVGRVLLVSAALAAVLALIALVVALAAKAVFLRVFWRLCSAAGGLILLLGGVLLLTRRAGRTVKMRFWEAHFPGLPFLAAVLLVGVVVLICAVLANAAVL